MTNNPAAEILEALGHNDRAALLRWGERPKDVVDLAEDNVALGEELSEVEANLALLESMLCRSCAKLWEEAS
jgi:hypothetical protein